MSKKPQTMPANYLDFIARPKAGVEYKIDEAGHVTIFQENKGFFNRIAQACFNRPRVTQVHLDAMGNFIWPRLDGQTSLLQIAEALHEAFGEKAEPLYNRLVQYIHTLESYGFIEVKNPEDTKEK